MMKKDVDYVVQDGEILIVDEFTGRIMYGRRYSNGLHQAIEAQNGLKCKRIPNFGNYYTSKLTQTLQRRNLRDDRYCQNRGRRI